MNTNYVECPIGKWAFTSDEFKTNIKTISKNCTDNSKYNGKINTIKILYDPYKDLYLFQTGHIIDVDKMDRINIYNLNDNETEIAYGIFNVDYVDNLCIHTCAIMLNPNGLNFNSEIKSSTNIRRTYGMYKPTSMINNIKRACVEEQNAIMMLGSIIMTLGPKYNMYKPGSKKYDIGTNIEETGNIITRLAMCKIIIAGGDYSNTSRDVWKDLDINYVSIGPIGNGQEIFINEIDNLFAVDFNNCTTIEEKKFDTLNSVNHKIFIFTNNIISLVETKNCLILFNILVKHVISSFRIILIPSHNEINYLQKINDNSNTILSNIIRVGFTRYGFMRPTSNRYNIDCFTVYIHITKYNNVISSDNTIEYLEERMPARFIKIFEDGKI